MNKKLYDLMDWAEIEAIVYSEADQPKKLLGCREIKRNGTLIQAYYPEAVNMEIKLGERGKWQEMDMADEGGFFSILTKEKLPFKYTLRRTMEDETVIIYKDAYSFDQIIPEKELAKFNAGINYEAYRYLGAHIMTVDGVSGVHFAVWAPNAVRVSVVGDFNSWDGRIHQMQRLSDSGVFEIFIPDVGEGDIYKYEIKLKGGVNLFKADPYGFGAELRPATASVVRNLDDYTWKDSDFVNNRSLIHGEDKPMFVYELHLSSFKKPDDGREFYNYRELAPLIADYVKKMGYTHVELMPVMEHLLDESWGYLVTGYYAPTSRYGSLNDFKYFVDYLHLKGIGVILDWVPAHFPKDDPHLRYFDGTHLYEHADKRKGEHPHWGTLIYNYGRPEVANFLIANCLYWVREFHADGIRMDAVASMLYLDYGRNDGEWIPNMYGGKENLEAIEFFKHLNSIFKKEFPDRLLIAEESTAWPQVTGSVKNDGLGFDMKWNMGWMNDFLSYMSYDPLYRTHHYNELCFSMIYAYSEKFMLPFSHDEVVHGKGTLISRMPGTIEEKFASLKSAYGHMLTHPGKKLLFMGQDIAEFDEWNEKRSVQWELLKYENHENLQKFLKDMIKLYKEQPALHELDNVPEGFEWINCISANENIIVYLRKGKNAEDTLLVICNFENIPRNNYKIGVPYPCKLKELINSDSEDYGGFGFVNSRVKMSKKDECDGRENSIRIKVPPLAVTVFKVEALVDEEVSATPKRKTVKKPETDKNIAKAAAAKTKKAITSKKSADAKASLDKNGTKKGTGKNTKKESSAKSTVSRGHKKG